MRNKIFFLFILVAIFQISISSGVQNQVINLENIIETDSDNVFNDRVINLQNPITTIIINSSSGGGTGNVSGSGNATFIPRWVSNTSLGNTPMRYDGDNFFISSGTDHVWVSSASIPSTFVTLSDTFGGGVGSEIIFANTGVMTNSILDTGGNQLMTTIFAGQIDWAGNTFTNVNDITASDVVVTTLDISNLNGVLIGTNGVVSNQSILTAQFGGMNNTNNYNHTLAALNITGNLFHNKTQVNTIVNNLANSTIARIGNCTGGQVVQNTTNNGVQCVTVSGGSNFLNLSGTNANQNVDINPYLFKSYGIRIGANATRYGDTYTIQNVITQNKTVNSYGNIKWSVFSAIADSYGSQPYAGIHELINDTNTGAISYAITSTRLGVSGLSFAINPEDEFGGLGFPIRVSRLSDDGSSANFQVNGGISTNDFLNVSNNIEASSYSVGGVVGVSCAGDVSDSQNGIVTGCFSSDERLKENIVPLTQTQTEKLMQLKLYNFDFNDEYYRLFPNQKRESHIGFLAQELALIFPEAVKNSSILIVTGNKTIIANRTLRDGSIESYNKTVEIIEPTYFETVSTYPIIVGLVKGFQEQQTKIEELEQRIANLESKSGVQPMSDEGSWFTNLFS